MQIKLNGKIIEVPSPVTIQELLVLNNFPSQHTVIEMNGNIIKSDLWVKTLITSGDELEIIKFVGGG